MRNRNQNKESYYYLNHAISVWYLIFRAFFPYSSFQNCLFWWLHFILATLNTKTIPKITNLFVLAINRVNHKNRYIHRRKAPHRFILTLVAKASRRRIFRRTRFPCKDSIRNVMDKQKIEKPMEIWNFKCFLLKFNEIGENILLWYRSIWNSGALLFSVLI